jgi:hypothetical protein
VHSATHHAEHLVPLSDGWHLWRRFALRGSGFPVDLVTRLGDGATAGAADALLAQRDALSTSRDALAAACDRAGVELRRSSRAGQVLNALAKGKRPPEDALDTPEIRLALAAFDASSARAVELERELDAALSAARRREALELCAVAQTPHFREAVGWQNLDVLLIAVDRVGRSDPLLDNSKARYRQALVWRYLQRYCTKNETVGFFGPQAWAWLGDSEPLRMRPGPSLLAWRGVFFEHWTMQAFAKTLLDRRPNLRRFLPPRRSPAIRLEGLVLHHPQDRRTTLEPAFARLLAACDGETPAYRIVSDVLADPQLGLESEDEVFELLEQLAAQRLAMWTLEVPTHTTLPECDVRRRLQAIDDQQLRADCVRDLDALIEGRDAVARVAGDAEQVVVALRAFRDTFVELTGSATTRQSGVVSAGQTTLFEDCRRDLDFELGPALRAPFAAPLALLLQSARWFTHTIGASYAALLDREHSQIAAETGSGEVDYQRLLSAVLPDLDAQLSAPPIVAEAVRELRARWAELLPVDASLRTVTGATSQLAPGVARAFEAPGPGWPMARFQAPDLLVAAKDADALRRGECQFVLGELHVAYNPLVSPFIVMTHPDPTELANARRHDVPRVVSVVRTPAVGARAQLYSIVEGDLELEVAATPSLRLTSSVLRPGELFVVRGNAGLEVRSRDGRHALSMVETIDYFLSSFSTRYFDPFAFDRHRPRIAIDGLVVAREAWRFDAEEVRFAESQSPAARFVAVRHWARKHQLRRFLFYSVPTERKPFFLDLESPIAVETFAKVVRDAPRVTVSEMLPAPDEAWLEDAEGRRYTSELRLVAVDPVAWGGGR